MTISKELEAKILRYFHVEKWLVGTIASQFGVHHGTVDRVLQGYRIKVLSITDTPA